MSISKDWMEVVENTRGKEVIAKEMRALLKNKTWKLTTLPTRKRVVSCKWVFCVMQKLDRSIDWCKTRLVVKGYIQTYEIDYQEMFDFVAKNKLNQGIAFLHRNLEEKVYMKITSGFSCKKTEGKVCKINVWTLDHDFVSHYFQLSLVYINIFLIIMINLGVYMVISFMFYLFYCD